MDKQRSIRGDAVEDSVEGLSQFLDVLRMHTMDDLHSSGKSEILLDKKAGRLTWLEGLVRQLPLKEHNIPQWSFPELEASSVVVW